MSLSVRGEANWVVPPDSAVLRGRLSVARASKQDALRAVTVALDALIADLASLGGVPLGVEAARAALTWSARSATSHAEREHDPRTGRGEATGRVLASVALDVAVRDFALLSRLGAHLGCHEQFDLGGVAWYVDDDNAAWPAVRTAAVHAALRKARDYAAALGGSLTSVEHIADVGLLAGTEAPRLVRHAPAWSAAAAGPGSGAEAPTLDPVPQELTAVVEARFQATCAPLAETHRGQTWSLMNNAWSLRRPA